MTQSTPPQQPALAPAAPQIGDIYCFESSRSTETFFLVLDLPENLYAEGLRFYSKKHLFFLEVWNINWFTRNTFTKLPAEQQAEMLPLFIAHAKAELVSAENQLQQKRALPLFISHAQADLAEAETVAQQKRDRLALVESFGDQIIERWCVKHGSFVAWRDSALACLELLETRITFPSPDMDGLYAAHGEIQRIKEDGCFARGSWKIFREKP